MTTSIPDSPIAALVSALRGGDTDQTGRLAAPVIDRCFPVVVRRCEHLVAGTRASLALEGADIALEAWEQVLRRVADGRTELSDETHLLRLLLRTAKCRFLDHLAKARRRGITAFEPLENSAATVREGPGSQSDLLLGADNELLRWVERLFRWDEIRFRAERPPILRRGLHQYRGLVLFHLGEMALLEDSAEGRALVTRYAHLLAVPAPWWEIIAHAVAAPGADEATLFEVVNRVCGTTFSDRRILSVLRYELHRAACPRPARPVRYDAA
ncbi:MAG: hypothetical protein ACKO5K_03455 [Armatimonadota bacterium]